MVTMSDIAARVGVSRATVSYVLNGRDVGISIREDTRKKILETAAEMGYRRNELARAVVTGKNFVLGFLVHGQNEVANRILFSAQEEADRSGYLIKPLSVNQDYRGAVQRCIEQRLAGVLLIAPMQDALDHLHAEASRFNMPIAMMDNTPPQNWGIHVIADNELGLRLTLEHLIGLGHRRIAFVSAQPTEPVAREREAEFRKMSAALGLPLEERFIIATSWDKPHLIEPGVESLLCLPDRPTALVCAGDKIAIIAQRAARRVGLRLPHDLSITGFSDLELANFADPPLTTVAQPVEDIGREATRQILAAIENPEAYAAQEPLTVILPTKLIVRESTAPVPLSVI